jgi:hypothetical protein
MMKNIRFTSAARKHKIGAAHARFVISNNQPLRTPGNNDFEQRLFWIGFDDRGLELEIAGVEFDNEILVIHVMPTIFRLRGRHE